MPFLAWQSPLCCFVSVWFAFQGPRLLFLAWAAHQTGALLFVTPPRSGCTTCLILSQCHRSLQQSCEQRPLSKVHKGEAKNDLDPVPSSYFPLPTNPPCRLVPFQAVHGWHRPFVSCVSALVLAQTLPRIHQLLRVTVYFQHSKK